MALLAGRTVAAVVWEVFWCAASLVGEPRSAKQWLCRKQFLNSRVCRLRFGWSTVLLLDVEKSRCAGGEVGAAAGGGGALGVVLDLVRRCWVAMFVSSLQRRAASQERPVSFWFLRPSPPPILS